MARSLHPSLTWEPLWASGSVNILHSQLELSPRPGVGCLRSLAHAHCGCTTEGKSLFRKSHLDVLIIYWVTVDPKLHLTTLWEYTLELQSGSNHLTIYLSIFLPKRTVYSLCVKYVKKLRIKEDRFFLDFVARSKCIDFEVDTRAL